MYEHSLEMPFIASITVLHSHIFISHFLRLELAFQDVSRSSVRLPHASTCALELFLPRGEASAADLLALLSRAVCESLGFTCFPTEEHGEDSFSS